MRDYKQLQLDTTEVSVQALVSKKGKASIRQKKAEPGRTPVVLEHNRKKKYVLREGVAALLTDAFRAELLELEGYQVQVLEFIDMEHTPKNILIRAVKRNKGKMEAGALEKCMQAWGADPLLYHLLRTGGKHEKNPD